jgi:hypothetical protein
MLYLCAVIVYLDMVIAKNIDACPSGHKPYRLYNHKAKRVHASYTPSRPNDRVKQIGFSCGVDRRCEKYPL